MFTGFDLPNITDEQLDDRKERRRIAEYLYQLTEQLRYTLNNIGPENLTDELNEAISGDEIAADLTRKLEDTNGNISILKQRANLFEVAVSNAENDIAELKITASSLESIVANAAGDISALEQFADSLTLSVTNGTYSSLIQLEANGIAIASQTVQFTGDIIFVDDLTDGTTVISGGNILTGMIAAARIDVNNLYVKHLEAADGSFNYLKVAGVSGTPSNGSVDLNGWLLARNVLAHAPSSGAALDFSIHFLNNIAEVISSAPMRIGAYLNSSITNAVTLYGTEIYFTVSTTYNNMFISRPGTTDASLVPQANNTCNIGTNMLQFDYIYAAHHTQQSSRRFKTEIEDADLCIDFDRFRPVTYRLKDGPQARQIGFVAEEVADICPALVVFNKNGDADGLEYDKFTVILVEEVKRLRTRVRMLEEKTA